MRRFILYLVIVLFVFTGCSKHTPELLFPINIDDVENKIADKCWTVTLLEGHSKNTSHFQIKKYDGISIILGTMGNEEERYMSINFYFDNKFSELAMGEFYDDLPEILTLSKELYGLKQDLNTIFIEATDLSNSITEPKYSWQKRIDNDIVGFGFELFKDHYRIARIVVSNMASYEKSVLGLANNMLSSNISTKKYRNVSDLSDEKLKNGDMLCIKGKLKDIKEIESDYISYVKSAKLVDNTGSMEVILIQNAFNDKELYAEREHYIYYDESVSSFVVQYSPKIVLLP